MPDEMIQPLVETDAMDEIFQTPLQIGEVVENKDRLVISHCTDIA